MTYVVLTNSITIGRGCLLNLHVSIGHDTHVGDFVEMSPGVRISGNCQIGNYCNLGTNAVVLPGVNLGDNVVVGAGAVVTEDVPANTMVVGVPARKIKELQPV